MYNTHAYSRYCPVAAASTDPINKVSSSGDSCAFCPVSLSSSCTSGVWMRVSQKKQVENTNKIALSQETEMYSTVSFQVGQSRPNLLLIRINRRRHDVSSCSHQPIIVTCVMLQYFLSVERSHRLRSFASLPPLGNLPCELLNFLKRRVPNGRWNGVFGSAPRAHIESI